MQRLWVVACLMAGMWTVERDSEARSSAVGALKQRGAVLWSRWQQRVGALPRVKKSLLQAGMAAALCTTLACGGVTQSPEVVESAPAVVSAPQIVPERQENENLLIVTKLYGKGFTAARGIPAGSIEAYEQSKTELPVQFYDGMMVHYVEDGRDFVRIVDLFDDKVLKVRHLGGSEVVVDPQTIEGIMVGEHHEYGRVRVSMAAQHVRSLNTERDASAKLLDSLPEGTVFHGVPQVIFSNGVYVVNVDAFSIRNGPIQRSSTKMRFVASVEDLVISVAPAPSPPHRQQLLPRPRPEGKQRLIASLPASY